ncbi:hypothetical protein Tco_0335748 [Tanacetum coccineum]
MILASFVIKLTRIPSNLQGEDKEVHDSKIKKPNFNSGDQVLLFNSRLKIFSGKLKSRWFGPFTITEVYSYGTAKLSHADGSNFKVNCRRLKHYYGGDTPPLIRPNNSEVSRVRYGCIKDHKKTVKNGQARTRESEEYKKKPKNQSRSQKSQASAKS